MSQSKKSTYDYIGCDYYGTCTSHLVIATANGATANSYGDTYYDGNQIIIAARDSDTNEIYGFLAIASGDVIGKSGDIWPAYHRADTPANQIVPITKIHKLPTDIIGRLSQRGIDSQYRAAVATYLLLADN